MRLIDQSISDILRHGWQLTDGAKQPIILAGIIYLIVTSILQLPGEFIDAEAEITSTGQMLWIFFCAALSLGSTIIGLPMLAGWLMMGVKRARNQALHPNQVWDYMAKTGATLLIFLLNLLIYAVIIGVMVGLSMLLSDDGDTQNLLVLGAILIAFCAMLYLAFCFSFGLYVLVDQNYGPLQALLRSREIVRQHFWKLAIVQSIFGMLFLLSILTLGIAWIWLAPWFAITWGALYQDLFVEPEEKTTEIFDNSRYHQVF